MTDLSQRTVTFLIKESQVLLGYKKTGFGKGNYLGIGGKVEQGETIEEAASREVKEEINVTHLELRKVADLQFLFPEKPSWSQHVHVYLTNTWKNQPQETEEIRPEWFPQNNLPFTQMWDDAKFWLPAVLSGNSLQGIFIFNTELKVIRVELSEKSYG